MIGISLALTAVLLAPTAPHPSADPGRPTTTANRVVCNRYCDARDPALATADRAPVRTALFGRGIVLHLNDTDAMGWASIETGNAGDEVWLDRSFDGGRSWADGTRLGVATTAAGQRASRTAQYNNDDWNARGVGALRACGRAGDRPEIACTPWARSTWNAWDRRTAAATALMQFYDTATGLFATTGWWNSANALTSVIDNIRRSGMTSYRYAIENTHARNVGAHLGNFTNDYLDDTGWWAMAWIGAYDLTGDARYLATARAGAEHMARYWDTVCGGGVWWSTARTYKNAITNSLYVQVNAALHNRIAGDSVHLERARAGWAWYAGTGMVDARNLVVDGISLSTCRAGNPAVWSYNQGVLVAALTELSRATGDTAVLARARQIADAATTNAGLNPGGILRDSCESGDCGADGPSFKGAHVRGLATLNAALPDHPYTTYLRRQADAAHGANRTPLDTYGLRWTGPVDKTDAARQHSAVDLLNAT
jgi:predicted alpha-1,6-mannanase (GH76 family)